MLEYPDSMPRASSPSLLVAVHYRSLHYTLLKGKIPKALMLRLLWVHSILTALIFAVVLKTPRP